MARTPSPENKKIPIGVTVKKWVKDKLEEISEEEDISISKYVEKAIIEKIEKDGK